MLALCKHIPCPGCSRPHAGRAGMQTENAMQCMLIVTCHRACMQAVTCHRACMQAITCYKARMPAITCLGLACTPEACVAGHEVVSGLVQCLAAWQDSPSPDSNLLALDALEVLHKIGPRLSLQGLPPEVPSALLHQLCQAMNPHCSPFRLRITAAGKHKAVSFPFFCLTWLKVKPYSGATLHPDCRRVI